jgi:predicted metal-dependent RNase
MEGQKCGYGLLALPTAFESVPSMKRSARDAFSTRTVIDDSVMEITTLGAGSEVGRSCILLKYKGKTIMLDCGVHPAYSGENSLPLYQNIDVKSVDLLLVSQYVLPIGHPKYAPLYFALHSSRIS